MSANDGKAFEAKFKKDFQLIDGATIDRLYDPVGGYSGIKNVCDFIGYIYPNIYYVECKSHTGNTFPFANLTQYDKLAEKVGVPGVRVGVVLWMIDHGRVVYLPISTITKMKEDGLKSFNVKLLDANVKMYNILEIPGEKKRKFVDSDYSVLRELKDGD